MLLLLSACSFRVCEPVEPLASLPTTLSATGLYEDLVTGVLAPDVVAYEPRFPLWSDGLEKERWALIPGEVDRSDPDDWRFPEGTRLWKQFSEGGAPVETRLLAKVGPGDADWTAVSYVWDGDDAVAKPAGVVDASPSGHDVPAAEDCFACHGGTVSRALGVSTVQLADGPLRDQLVGEPAPAVPGSAVDQAALGYLHGNCGHCHNGARPKSDGARCYDPQNAIEFRLSVGELRRVEDTAAWRTAVGEVIRPGNADQSAVIHLVDQRERGLFMPPIGSEVVDDDGVASLRRWIDSL